MPTKRLADALALAIEAHTGQYRKGTTIPYIVHPLGVASIALEYHADEDQAIAGLLHDVLEDSGDYYSSIILEKFGERVHAIVQACTDGLPDENGQKSDWHPRKLNYLEYLKTVSEDVILVVSADKLHNIRSIIDDFHVMGDSVFDKFTPNKEETLWYYRSVAEIAMQHSSLKIAYALNNAVMQMEKLVSY
jgi:(p)ppGpp synthase/HD superfamily hydrolase